MDLPVVLSGLGLKHHLGMDERWLDEAIKKVNRRIGEIRSEQGGLPKPV
jgi:hypothetical protein